MKNTLFQNPKLLLALALTSGLAVSSWLMIPDAQGKGPGMGHHMDEFYDAIDATDAQEDQLEALHQQSMTQMKPVKEAVFERKADLAVYILSTGATKEEALRREAELQQLKAQMGQMAIEEAFAKKAILSPEQQQKAAAFLQKKASEMKKNPPAKMDD